MVGFVVFVFGEAAFDAGTSQLFTGFASGLLFTTSLDCWFLHLLIILVTAEVWATMVWTGVLTERKS